MCSSFAQLIRHAGLSTATAALLLSLPPARAWAGGTDNTTTGVGALPASGTGNYNTADGFSALGRSTSANYNTAVGYNSLLSTTNGSQNVALGAQALQSNTSGYSNTAVGVSALKLSTTGVLNTAVGNGALLHNTTGGGNTASGVSTMNANTTGASNTATGYAALFANVTGNTNTADGIAALGDNVSGFDNVAVGSDALSTNVSGAGNTALGVSALGNNTGNYNIAIGDGSGQHLTDGADNIDIGNAGVGGESNVTRIGIEGSQAATFIAGIYGESVAATGVEVFVDANGQLGTQVTNPGTVRDIREMGKASDALLALRPVSFRAQPEGSRQFGLLADDVEKVNPALVAHDADGKPYGVRYAQVNAMLLNEFLKEHVQVQAQAGQISRLQSAVDDALGQIRQLKAGIAPAKPN